MSRFSALACLSLCLLSACGGGGAVDGTVAPPPVPIDPAGIWRGTANGSGSELGVALMSEGLGSAYAILNAADGTPSEALYLGGFSTEEFVPGNGFSRGYGFYRHVGAGFYQTVGSAAMTVVSGMTQKTLQFQVAQGIGAGNPHTVTLGYDTQFDKAVALANLVGTYTSKAAGNALGNLTISDVDPDSMLVSGHAACAFSYSRITSLSSTRNLFSVAGVFKGPSCAFQGAAFGNAYAELGSSGQVMGINIAMRATDGSSFYVYQGVKN